MKTHIRRRSRWRRPWRPWMTDVLALAAALAFFVAALLTPLMARAEPAGSVIEAANAVMAPGGPDGMTVLVYCRDRRLWRMDFGDIAPDAALPVASASKWAAAALVMTAVDDGLMALDAPVGVWLPDASGPGTAASVRQLLSFTAGQGGLSGGADTRQSTRMTLQESAAQIARRPLVDPAGSTFRYGGPSLQLAGAALENATGLSWNEAFRQRLAAPLGLTDARWSGALGREAGGPVTNPNLQAGLVITAEDYGRFIAMLANDGVFAGREVLSPGAVDALMTVQTDGAVMAFLPPGAGSEARYNLGSWCEQAWPDGRCRMASSPGALGAYPWVDRETGLAGLFFMRHRLPPVAEALRRLRARIVETASCPGGTEMGPVTFRYRLTPPLHPSGAPGGHDDGIKDKGDIL
jgi:CubicO group peptidase (beta-lactamase class C family)